MTTEKHDKYYYDSMIRWNEDFVYVTEKEIIKREKQTNHLKRMVASRTKQIEELKLKRKEVKS